MSFNLIAAYCWTYHKITSFLRCKTMASSPNANYSANNYQNFNTWNFDFSYSLWFAPASEIAILYRNYVLERTNLVEKNMSANLSNVFDSKLTTILSVSIRF